MNDRHRVIPSETIVIPSDTDCHPERQRGILSATLVAGHEKRIQDPSLSLGMTDDSSGFMTLHFPMP